AIQDRYGVSDGLLPVFLAAVPILAGVGSGRPERLGKRIPPSRVLRGSQAVPVLALVGVGGGGALEELGLGLAVFGLAVGVLDASMNMLGVRLQRS
ncbi:transporter, partial [Streptomyces viridochromogenes]